MSRHSADVSRKPVSTGASGTVVAIQALSIRYGSVTAVREVSLTVGAGEIVGLVGPNGAGKTSIVETVGGLRNNISGGSVAVCGLDPRRDRGRVSRLVGMQLQESLFPSRTRVGELADLYESIYDAPGAAAALLEKFGIADRRHSLTSSLSGGMRQRLALALAQVGDVRLVILDELTTGLDPEQRRETWRAVTDLAERGVAVLLTSHYMDEVEALCDRVGVLRRGKLVALGSPAAITAEHGGPATFSIDLPANDPALPRLDALELERVSTRHSRTVDLAGRFPEDYNRITEILSRAGYPASLVKHRAPTFEDAYLLLVDESTTSEVQA